MAKIGSLEVGTIKFASGAATQFFSPSGSSITISNSLGVPNFIFVASTGSGTLTLTRSRDSAVIFTGTGYLREVGIDPNPQSSETYTISGGTIIGGMVSLK